MPVTSRFVYTCVCARVQRLQQLQARLAATAGSLTSTTTISAVPGSEEEARGVGVKTAVEVCASCTNRADAGSIAALPGAGAWQLAPQALCGMRSGGLKGDGAT